MSRYVDVDKFEKYFDREEWRTPDEKWWPEREIGMVINDILSTTDVVEVVRCKDCIHMNTDKCPIQLNDADFYCCQGERRTNEI